MIRSDRLFSLDLHTDVHPDGPRHSRFICSLICQIKTGYTRLLSLSVICLIYRRRALQLCFLFRYLCDSLLISSIFNSVFTLISTNSPRLYQTSISPLRVRTSMMVCPKKSSLSRLNLCFTRDLMSSSSSHTRTLMRSVELWHSLDEAEEEKWSKQLHSYYIQALHWAYKWKLSSQTGLRLPYMVLVLFLVFPTWTVTYGSLEPVLSLACRPWAQATERETDWPHQSWVCMEPYKYLYPWIRQTNPPVMLIFADHLDVPSSTLCLICFMCVACVALSRANTSCISSKISGLFLSLIFMRSLRTMMMFWVRSSAPCLELFSAAPDETHK